MKKTGTGDVLDHHGGRLVVECQVCWLQWSYPFINGGEVPPDWDKCQNGCNLSDLPDHWKDWLDRWDIDINVKKLLFVPKWKRTSSVSDMP